MSDVRLINGPFDGLVFPVDAGVREAARDDDFVVGTPELGAAFYYFTDGATDVAHYRERSHMSFEEWEQRTGKRTGQ